MKKSLDNYVDIYLDHLDLYILLYCCNFLKFLPRRCELLSQYMKSIQNQLFFFFLTCKHLLYPSAWFHLLSTGIKSGRTYRLVWVSRIHGPSHHQTNTILASRPQNGSDLKINDHQPQSSRRQRIGQIQSRFIVSVCRSVSWEGGRLWLTISI